MVPNVEFQFVGMCIQRSYAIDHRPAPHLVLVMILVLALSAVVHAQHDLRPMLTHADDYTFGYYPYGWRGANANGDRIFAIQTNRYALAINTTAGRIDRIGALQYPAPAREAVLQGNDLLDRLPALQMTCEAVVDGVRYVAAQGAPKPDAVVLQRMGRFLQHVQVRGLTLRAASGSEFGSVNAWFEVYAWSDRASVIFHVEPLEGTRSIKPALRFSTGGMRVIEEQEVLVIRRDEEDGGVALVSPVSDGQDVLHESDSILVRASAARVAVAIVPDSVAPLDAGLREAAAIRAFSGEPVVHATGVAPYAGLLDVAYDSAIGWHRVVLGENPDINVMERVHLELENRAQDPRTVRLCFAKEGGSFGITGMSPVLRDMRGLPIGLPVQISKNWHVQPAWFTGLTILELEPGAENDLEFDVAYARWGGVPAVSHAQLCLDGWGTNQQWDQMAIGSFGESICYDPDVNLNRGLIDDMRPLMVWGMGSQSNKQWSWTHNVGGGDFLVLFKDGRRQFLSRQKTLYEHYGPVLSDVTYAGETPDGAIQSTVRTQSWRTDDYVRAAYTLRYDVVRPVNDLERLAFFQLGADHYNHNVFTTVTVGNLDGAVESWEPEMGGWKYSRRSETMGNGHPWIALTGATKNPPPYIKEDDRGAWANRGFIVRSWQARLGGEEVLEPHYSVFGTEDGNVPSAVVELSPPPGVTALHPGDFVEAEVEMLILPQRAEDYYGPNEGLRAMLSEHPDSWRLVHREAVRGNLTVTAQTGNVERTYPVAVRAGKNGRGAEFAVRGGVGYVPITITGAAGRGPFTLTESTEGATRTIDQSTNAGNDWWQALFRPKSQTYDLTFTIPMDGANQIRTYTWVLDESVE